MIKLNEKIAKHEAELAKLRAERAGAEAKAKGAEAREAEAKAKQAKLKEGEIVASSNDEGFTWMCNANVTSIVRHVESTINSAKEAIGDNEMGKVILAMGIMKAVQEFAKEEASK